MDSEQQLNQLLLQHYHHHQHTRLHPQDLNTQRRSDPVLYV
jgi:hypothetical protein